MTEGNETFVISGLRYTRGAKLRDYADALRILLDGGYVIQKARESPGAALLRVASGIEVHYQTGPNEWDTLPYTVNCLQYDYYRAELVPVVLRGEEGFAAARASSERWEFSMNGSPWSSDWKSRPYSHLVSATALWRVAPKPAGDTLSAVILRMPGGLTLTQVQSCGSYELIEDTGPTDRVPARCRISSEPGKLREPEVLRWIADLTEALQAHEAGK